MFLLRWLMPWRRQKAQSGEPQPTTEFIELFGVWYINQQLIGNAQQPETVANLGFSQQLEAETRNTYMIVACYPKAQSVAIPTLLFELSGTLGSNRQLMASVQLVNMLTAYFDLAQNHSAQVVEYDLKGEYD